MNNPEQQELAERLAAHPRCAYINPPNLNNPEVAGVLLRLVEQLAPRRVRVSLGGAVSSSVRMSMLGAHLSNARPRAPQRNWVGDCLGEACARALLNYLLDLDVSARYSVSGIEHVMDRLSTRTISSWTPAAGLAKNPRGDK